MFFLSHRKEPKIRATDTDRTMLPFKGGSCSAQSAVSFEPWQSSNQGLEDSRTNRPSSPLKENSWHRKVDVRGQLTKMRKENQADRNPYEKPASNAKKNHPATVVCFKVHVCACLFLAEARIISCKLKLLSSSDPASGGSAHDHRSLWKSQSKPQAISGSWSSTWRNRGGLTISYHIWAHVKPLGPR